MRDGLPGGLVSFVGAGPGDPDLLTLQAVRRLQSADLVLHDGLVPAGILALAPQAEHREVSRRFGCRTRPSPPSVVREMTEASRRGWRVVRLKAGDPFVFGRGGEEALGLAADDVPFEIVPGLTSAVAGPALAGIPVTHRGVASAFVVVSGHSVSAYGPVLASLAPDSATVVVLMGFAERASISALMMSAGWRPGTPAAVITNASQDSQRVWRGDLRTLERSGGTPSTEDAHVIVVGEVVRVGQELAVAADAALAACVSR